jgi:hypothetical protein
MPIGKLILWFVAKKVLFIFRSSRKISEFKHIRKPIFYIIQSVIVCVIFKELLINVYSIIDFLEYMI